MATKASGALETLKLEVRQKFAEILAAVQMREKLLLRQLDVIATSQLQHNAGGGGGGGRCHVTSSTQQNSTLADIKFLAEQETELMSTIRSFGRFQLDNMNLALHDVYLKNEDYIEPTDDHETMYKCLPEVSGSAENDSLADAEHHQKGTTTTVGGVGAVDEEPEAIVVDFSRNKSLVEHSRKLMNRSIINITLQEAKELIRKARLKRESSIPPLNLEELDDEMESSIADALSSLECRSDAAPKAANGKQKNKVPAATQQAEASTTTTSTSTAQQSASSAANIPKKCNKKRCKPKITINNCNGTINLRNISSLTINCASEEAISAEIPLHGQSDDEEEEVLPTKSATPAPKSKKSGKKSATSTVNSVKKALECIVYSSSTNNTETSTSTTTPTTSTPSSSNYSSNASSRSQSKKQSKTPKKSQPHAHEPPKTNSNPYGDHGVFADYDAEDDGDANVNATCDFYNRLLNEIKNNLHEKPMRYYKVPTTTEGGAAASSTSTAMEPDSTSFNAADNTSYIGSSSNNIQSSTMASTTNTQVTSTQGTQGPQPGKRLILKNFENLKIILEANSGDEDTFHPVQIEQWLAEIISESDLEPMPNTDILEHSNLHSMNENVQQQDAGGGDDDDGEEVGSESKAIVA